MKDDATTTTVHLQQTPNLPLSPSSTNNKPTNNEAERLSSDLALFLSNPTLRQGLADGSLDLASYSSTIESELLSLERDCIDVYRSNAGTVASLRVEMDECDVVLSSLQEMLLGFQADLGGLSGDIKALQEQSRTLGVQLRNRRDAEMGLRRFLERVVVSPSLADAVCTGEISPAFLTSVQQLEEKYQYLQLGMGPSQEEANDHHPDPAPAGDPSDSDTEATNTLQFLQTTSCGIPPAQTPAGREMLAHITKLRLRAVSRTRSYFLRTIAEIRRPKTNVRMIQVHQLLRYGPLADFLLEANPEIYGELRDVYVESMGKTLHALFRTYAAQLGLLDSRICGRGDVIAVEEGKLRDVFSSRVDMTKRGDAFYLGERMAVLEYGRSTVGSGRNNGVTGAAVTTTGNLIHAASGPNTYPAVASMGGTGTRNNNSGTKTAHPVSNPTNTPILAHVALSEGRQFPYEVIFKSIMMHLLDAATNEYIFVRQFFKENGPETFHPIFGRTLNLILEQLENCLFNCYDCLGLLLMIKLTHANRRIMKQRRVDSLDKFFDSVTNLLWPRLKTVMDKQIRSVREGDAKKLGFTELHAHYVSRRYAEFTCSILQILNKGNRGGVSPVVPIGVDDPRFKGPAQGTKSSDTNNRLNTAGAVPSRGSAGDMLLNDLSVLLDETVLLLERLAEGHSTNKKKIVFLINNIDQIISIFQERRVSGRELNRFVDLLMQQRELFVEEELLQGFSKMIAFVQQTEQHMMRPTHGGGGNSGKVTMEDYKVDVNVQVVESLVREFSSTWKRGIEQVNRNVLSFFANFRNGMEILKQVLTQLLLYYTRFQDIIRKVWRSKPPAFCKDLVSTSTILIEIKKHALAI